ncbi:BspA family leucine-rich repeat surface protein, partial [Helicobacter typhlonius]
KKKKKNNIMRGHKGFVIGGIIMENKKESKELTPQEKRNKELYDVLSSCLDAPKEELESLKAKVLALIEKGAVIDKEKISELEAYVSDLEQEYWDDSAVYAGRSAKDTEEYALLQILKKLTKAKDKAKAFDSLFTPKTSQSKGVTYQPKTKAALKKLIKDESIYLGDIDVSGVSDFTNLFDKSKRKDFSGIEKWNVSHIKDMSFCFVEARHFNHDIGSWDVSNVEDMRFMFHCAIRFNQPLESWNVSKVKDMWGMFEGASQFNQPLEKWDVSNVEYAANMFAHAKKFNQPLDKWNLCKAKKIYQMFWNAKKFNQNLDSWGDKLPEGCKIGYWFKFVAFSPIDGEDKKPKWFVTTEDGLLKKN